MFSLSPVLILNSWNYHVSDKTLISLSLFLSHFLVRWCSSLRCSRLQVWPPVLSKLFTRIEIPRVYTQSFMRFYRLVFPRRNIWKLVCWEFTLAETLTPSSLSALTSTRFRHTVALVLAHKVVVTGTRAQKCGGSWNIFTKAVISRGEIASRKSPTPVFVIRGCYCPLRIFGATPTQVFT